MGYLDMIFAHGNDIGYKWGFGGFGFHGNFHEWITRGSPICGNHHIA